jgi:toxin CptA
LPLAVNALLALVVLVAVACAVRRVSRTDIVAVGLDQDGGWILRRADGTDQAATLTSSRVIGAYVLLRLAPAGMHAQTVMLGPDNSDADIRRRLRMRLAASGTARNATDP